MRSAPPCESATGTIPSHPWRGIPQHVETTSTLGECLDQLGIIRYAEWCGWSGALRGAERATNPLSQRCYDATKHRTASPDVLKSKPEGRDRHPADLAREARLHPVAPVNHRAGLPRGVCAATPSRRTLHPGPMGDDPPQADQLDAPCDDVGNRWRAVHQVPPVPPPRPGRGRAGRDDRHSAAIAPSPAPTAD